ncbi:hypothetical protein XU18_4718 [Perkinsela sp. CCAP 1560/4]|nr:hypothetical protein XU18_4718 [Perkinsela sp. CCAP 1560/4]|eukprot:KNH03961.1 hypothetical protein XU18_4718 [Perkinsela sp. CCAP 1560/4]
MPFINVQFHTPLSLSIEKALQEYVKRDKKPFTSHLWGTRHFFEKHSAIRAGETGYQVVEKITVFPFILMAHKDQEALMHNYDPSVQLKNTAISHQKYLLFHNSRWKHVQYTSQRRILDALVEKTRDFMQQHDSNPPELSTLFIAEDEVADRRMHVPPRDISATLPLYTSSEWMNVEQTTYTAAQQTLIQRDIADGRSEKRDELHARGRITAGSMRRGDISILAFSQTLDAFFVCDRPQPKEQKKSLGKAGGNGSKQWKTWKKRPTFSSRPSAVGKGSQFSQHAYSMERSQKKAQLPMWEFGDPLVDESSSSPTSLGSDDPKTDGEDISHGTFLENGPSPTDPSESEFGF